MTNTPGSPDSSSLNPISPNPAPIPTPPSTAPQAPISNPAPPAVATPVSKDSLTPAIPPSASPPLTSTGEDPSMIEQPQNELPIQPLTPIQFETKDGKLVLILPPPLKGQDDWFALMQRLQQRLVSGGKQFWPSQTRVELIAGERLIDQSQLRTLAQILETANLKLSCVHTTRRPTAVAAVTIGYSVQQQSPDLALGAQNIPNLKFSPAGETKQLSPPLVLTTTLRSGSDVRHPGHVILIGDLNPGGAIVADGDILVWGRLRGIAHAGAKGNRSACIMALQMEPTQLRIADQVARAPSAKLDEFYPEVASIVANGIQIVRAYDFSR